MVTILGSHLCKGCQGVMAVMKEEGLEAEFLDITKDLGYMKRFLRLRETTPELMKNMLAEDRVGIPLFILADGTITVDKEAGIQAMRDELKK